MAKKILAICDKDECFLFKLRDYLISRDTFPFEINTYTDVSILENDLEKGFIELALIDDSFILNLKKVENNNVIVFNTGKYDKGDNSTVWKYQSANSIRKEILRIYASSVNDNSDISEKNQSSKGKCKVIGFFSPVHRSMQTSIAITLGQILSENEKSLYLNMESISGFGKIGNDNHRQKDISDLIYFFRSGKGKLLYKFESMVCSFGKLDYIQPVYNFMDIEGITKDDWMGMINVIAMSGMYKNIILDITEADNGFLDILRRCDVIFSINRKDYFGKIKKESYIEVLNEISYEDVLNKTMWLDVPVFNKIPQDFNRLKNTEIWKYVIEMVADQIKKEEQYYAV